MVMPQLRDEIAIVAELLKKKKKRIQEDDQWLTEVVRLISFCLNLFIFVRFSFTFFKF